MIEQTLGKELLSFAVKHPGMIRDAIPVIRMEDFEDPLHGAVWVAIERASQRDGYLEKTSPASLVNEISDVLRGFSKEVQQRAYERLDRLLMELPAIKSTPETIRIAIERGVRTRLAEVLDNAKTNLFEGTDPEKAFEDICLEGRSVLRRGTPVKLPSVRAMLKKMDEAKGGPATEGVLTGLGPLDKLLNGGAGLGRGELGVVIGAPKGSKTAHLVHFAVMGAFSGVPVYYFSLELKSRTIIARMLACISGVKINDVLERGVSKALGEYAQVFDRVFVHDLPTGEATTRDLARLLRAGSMRPGMIVVDYGDLLKSGLQTRDGHDLDFAAQSTVFRSLRAMACEFNAPVWTATRCTRGAISKTWIRKEDVGMSIEKISIADVALAVCQTDAEVVDGKERLFVCASRIGPDNKTIACTVDKTKNMIKGERLLESMSEE